MESPLHHFEVHNIIPIHIDKLVINIFIELFDDIKAGKTSTKTPIIKIIGTILSIKLLFN